MFTFKCFVYLWHCSWWQQWACQPQAMRGFPQKCCRRGWRRHRTRAAACPCGSSIQVVRASPVETRWTSGRSSAVAEIAPSSPDSAAVIKVKDIRSYTVQIIKSVVLKDDHVIFQYNSNTDMICITDCSMVCTEQLKESCFSIVLLQKYTVCCKSIHPLPQYYVLRVI